MLLILKSVLTTQCTWQFIGNKSIDEIEAGKTTVNGIVTINPYLYIKELEAACNSLSLTATVNSNKNQS